MRTRRSFLEAGVPSLLWLAFLDSAVAAEAVSPAVGPVLDGWLRGLHGHSADLLGGAIPAKAWQDEVRALLERVPLDDLVRLIDLERLMREVALPDDRATTRDPVFPPLEGLAPLRSYVRRVFLLRQGRAIVPHGHRNMASGHLVIHGRFQVRHYERLGDEPQHLIVRPTIDRESRPGMATTVSDDKDNVHWLTALSEIACTFDVIVPGLDPARPTEFMDFIDPLRAEPLGQGRLRAPRLPASEVFRRYGNRGV
jgi:hypothetical protein